jgi:vacuolar-type H+-ATPase subunit H
MKAVVEEILAAEKRAEEVLDQARKRAVQLQQEADKLAASITAAAYEDAQKLLSERITAARNHAKTSRETALCEAETANRHFLEQNREKIDTLVDAIAEMVMAPLPAIIKK